MELVKSNVLFDNDTHTYTLDGKELSGVTKMLGRQLFPDKYDGVNEFVLNRAKEHGSLVHSICELYDNLGVDDGSPEVNWYKEIISEYGLTHEESEYLVSDEENYASKIDKVYRVDDNTFDIGDIKTTYVLDNEYLRWQLSVYAYMFELQNKGANVRNLYGIWLRPDKYQAVLLGRIPSDIIRSLLDADSRGVQFVNPYTPKTVELPQKYAAMEDSIEEIDRQCKYWSDKKKELTDGIKNEMVKAGVTKWQGSKVSFTRKEDSEREDFDKKQFAKDYPDLYRKYIVRTKVSGSVTLRIK